MYKENDMGPVKTIEDYLRGCVGIEAPDSMLSTVLYKRKLEAGSQVEGYSEKELDLAEAELLYSLTTMPSMKGSVEDSDDNWKHKEGQIEITATDKKNMLRRANHLREKWGESKFVSSVIDICSFGIQKVRLR